VDELIAFYKTQEEAGKAAEDYRKHQKVKTDVFRVEFDPEKGWFVSQDIS
jgi:hypothetical protein